MIAEIGHFALIMALCLAAGQALLPLLGSIFLRSSWMATARSLAAGQWVFVAISFACLVVVFLADDFSVRYVAENSNTLLPDHYKISAVWAAHEGSLLLWVLILASWTLAVALFSRTLPLMMVARVLAVMGMIAVGFYLFVLFTSNPFERILPLPRLEGADLNPLLQDFGLIVHPPMLYMGYVGFSVAFAFAIAALLSGRMDTAWARWTRPWTIIAWSFLTLGIALGSWWAYYELGWGGWWFWDPVENASFMPWLVGTALIHSLAVTEKRGTFRSWTLLLAILAFSLSLLGTFLVRSGVLTSVHAFASDPTRGVFILLFLAVVVGGSLFLYALRGPSVRGTATFTWLSREAFLLVNNVLLMVTMATILLGTLYPLVADFAGWGKVSVGPPYFNLFFIPLAGLLALFMAVGSILNWKRNDAPALRTDMLIMAGAALLVGVAGTLLIDGMLRDGTVRFGTLLTLTLASWVALVTGRDLWRKAASRAGRLQGLRRLRGSYYGMVLAHLGIAVAIMGVGISSLYSDQRDVRMAPGDRVSVGGYDFVFQGVATNAGPNYHAQTGTLSVTRDGLLVAELQPQKRRYFASGQVMTEADIDGGLWRDLYVALGESLDDQSWSVRVYVKPLVRWIWLGALLMAAGGLLATLDKRYRARRGSRQAATGSLAAQAPAVAGVNS